MFGVGCFDRARKNEIHCERRERILSQSLRSFERPKGKTLLIASRIDSSKVDADDGDGQTGWRSALSLLRPFVRSIDQMRFLRDHSRRFSKDFRMPPTPPPQSPQSPQSPAGAFSPH